MGLFDSTKKTSNTTQNFDQRVAASEDSVASGGSDNVVQILDGKAISKAFDFAEGGLSDTLDFAEESLDFGTSALESNEDIIDEAFDFGGDAFKFGGNALSASSRASDRALDFGGDALNSSSQALDRSLDFGGDALEVVEDFGTDSLNSLSGVLDRALAFGRDVVTETGKSLADTTAQVGIANRSDSANTLDTITKSGAVVIVAVLAFLIFKKG